MSGARQKLKDWLATIDVKADSVLDVGGLRWPIVGKDKDGLRVKSWDVKEYKILDTSRIDHRREVDYLWDINNHSHHFLAKFNSIPKFDVIFCIEVMQFIWNPIMALKNIRNFMTDVSILYINFHTIYPPMKDLDCLRYTKVGIYKMFKEVGLKVVECIPRKSLNIQLMRDVMYGESKVWKSKDEVGYFIKAKKI